MRLITLFFILLLSSNTTWADAIKACENAKLKMIQKESCAEEATQAKLIKCEEGIQALKAIIPIHNKCYDKSKMSHAANKAQIKKTQNIRTPASVDNE